MTSVEAFLAAVTFVIVFLTLWAMDKYHDLWCWSISYAIVSVGLWILCVNMPPMIELCTLVLVFTVLRRFPV